MASLMLSIHAPFAVTRNNILHRCLLPSARLHSWRLSQAPKYSTLGPAQASFASSVQSQRTVISQELSSEKSWLNLSSRLALTYEINQVSFVHGNVMDIDFNAFDAFYIFNPFYENVHAGKRMDNTVLLSPSLYESYSSYTSARIASLPVGTRLATYYTSPSIVPKTYEEVASFRGRRTEILDETLRRLQFLIIAAISSSDKVGGTTPFFILSIIRSAAFFAWSSRSKPLTPGHCYQSKSLRRFRD